MVGFDGPEAPVAEALAAGRVGGVILFARNVESGPQVRGLNARLRQAAGDGLPIAVDQEGGRVARLARAGLKDGPTARAVAARGDPAAAHRRGLETGKALKDLGFTLDFAPVLDVDTNPGSPVIGDRSYGPEPGLVTAFGREMALGLMEGGVHACGKHFPGHGDAALDSHRDLPTVAHDVARLERIELAPFAALCGLLPAIMTAHVRYPALDPDVPATLSAPIVTGLLKGRLGFGGVVVSDDLEMGAIADRYGPEEAAVSAVLAGVDLLLFCHRRERWEAAHAALVAEAERSPAFRARLTDAAARVGRLWAPPEGSP
jgi:beta-N-acetylhexosaminidase